MQRNPFSLPDRDDPRPPLDPLATRPDGDELYLNMDHTEVSYREFEKTFDPAEIVEKGCVVIAAGREGCGKTALVNRCASLAKMRLEQAGFSPVVLDLRSEARPAQSVRDRTQLVCRRMTDQLRAKVLLRGWDELMRSPDPEDVYANLGHYLVENVVVVALLPTSELGDELIEYAHFSRQKLLFFCEIRDLSQLGVVRRQLVMSGNRRPIVLDVGPLDPEHGWDFVTRRMADSGVCDMVPALAEETLRRMTTDRPISIGELQQLLYEMYEELLVLEQRPVEVTWHQVAEFYYRWADRRNHD